jgi:uncharacterized hydrophobic protein (TIGR00271 family)
MTVQIRITAPSSLAAQAVQIARGQEGASELSVFEGASVIPSGDVIVVQVVREAADELISKFRDLGIPEQGSISVTSPELVLSERTEREETESPGEAADAVIWDEVENTTSEESRLTWSFLAFLVIATQLACIGIITDSTIAIVGAMVVGPEFGPLAGLALSLVDRKWTLARESAVALGIGFPVAMLLAAAATWGSIPLGLVDTELLSHGNPATDFIYHPGPYSFIVALLAGAAGMLSLIGRKSAALVGVFISVTTVPAAGYVAVALVLGEWQKAAGSALQLLLNLAGIVLSAVAVLVFYRLVRRRQHDRDDSGKRPQQG